MEGGGNNLNTAPQPAPEAAPVNENAAVENLQQNNVDVKKSDETVNNEAVNNDAESRTEKAENISEAFRRALGKESSLLFDLENGGKINVVTQKKDLQNFSEDVNRVTEELMNANRGKDRIIKRIPIVGMVAGAVLTGIRRRQVVKKYNELGDLGKVYEHFGLEDKSGTVEYNGDVENRRRARLALEASGFEDTDAGDNMALLDGEKVEKSKSTNEVNEALTKLFEGYKNAEAAKFEDDKKDLIAEAESNYQQTIEQLKNEGKFGVAEESGDSKLSKLKKWLGSDAAQNKVVDLSELNEVSGAMKELAKHGFSKEQVADFLSNHVSLYDAKMKEGLYKEAKADGVYRALQVAGIPGAIAMSLFAYEGKSGGKAIAKKALGNVIASRVAVGAAAGAAMGGLTGALRGNAEADKRVANAEREAALSGEELKTREEQAATKEQVTADEQVAIDMAKMDAERAKFVSDELIAEGRGDEISASEPEKAEQKNATENMESRANGRKAKRGKIKQLLEKFVKEDEYVRGKYGIEGYRKRESAKNLYDKLDDLLTQGKNAETTEEIIETLADIRARNGVSNERKIDLIAYSKGNVAKERRMLVEKMIEAEKFLDINNAQNSELKDRLQEATEWRAKRLNRDANHAEMAEKEFKRKMVIARAVQGALVGGAIGAAAGAIYSGVQTARENGAFDSLKSTLGLSKSEAVANMSDEDIAGEMNNTVDDIGEEVEIQDSVEAPDTVRFSGTEDRFSMSDADGDGYLDLKIGDREILGGTGPEDGIQIDPETGALSAESIELLEAKGISVDYEPGAPASAETIADYFKADGENKFYVSSEDLHAEAGNFDGVEGYKAGYTFTDIERQGSVVSEGMNRAADIVNVRPVEEGIAFDVRAVGNDVITSTEDMDALKVVLTADAATGDKGIILDVASDGSVVIPAGSPAAQMFEDGYNFSGNTMQVVRGTDTGGFEVLSSSTGSGAFAGAEETFFVPAEVPSLQLTDANGISISGNVQEMFAASDVDATIASSTSGMVSGGEINVNEFTGTPNDVDYSVAQNEAYAMNAEAGFRVDGLQASTQSDEAMDQVRMLTRTEDYVPERDPYNNIEKVSGAFRGPNLTEQLAEAHNINVDNMSNNEITTAVTEAVERGDISTDEVVNAYLSEVGDSPEQLVEMRAMLGDLRYDIDGDGQLDLVDTEDEINVLANILKDGSDPNLKYSDFANDTFALLREKVDGGEIRLVNYAEEPYNRTTLGFSRDGDIRTAFAEKKTATYGVGIQFLDKDGRSIYDEEVVRKVWGLSPSQRIDQVTERLNCCQKTARISWIERVRQAKTEPEGTTKTEPESTPKSEPEKTQPEKTQPEKTQPEKTGNEKTEPEKTGKEKTDPEKTGSEKTEPEKVEDEKTEPEKTDIEKTEDEKTEPEKTEDEKTEPEKTDIEKTEPEKTESEKTEAEDTGLEPKTDTNPWEENNPEPMPTTPSFEEESAANGDAEIIQAGEENLPPAPDTSGVNENPVDQQDWAEQPTPPTPDTGTGGTVDMSPDTDQEAADMLAQAEAEARAAAEQNASAGGGANAA